MSTGPVFPRARPLRLWSALCTFLVACATTPSAAPPADVGTAPDPAEASSAADRSEADASSSNDELLDAGTAQRETARILAEVARARELEVTREVDVDVIDKPGIRAFAKDSMYEDTTPEEMRLLGRIEASMGALPLGMEPEEVMLDLLEQGVLGLYDPKKKILLIGNFVPKFSLSMVVGHEIAHGLQDMHFDLEKLQKPMRHQADAESARRFLVEGGAQAAYMAWVSGEEGLKSIGDNVLTAMGDQALELAGAASPYPVLARALQMPYADGTATIIRLVLRKGWKAVDALYQDLPDSTEQMLHIDKLLAREQPIAVRIDPAPLTAATGLKPAWTDTLGEASLLAMLASVEPATRARKAADGWGGDALIALDAPKAEREVPLVMAALAWDTEADAVQFEAAYAKYLAEELDPQVQRSFIERRKDVVVFATGVPANLDEAAFRKAAWSAVEVHAKPRSPAP